MRRFEYPHLPYSRWATFRDLVYKHGGRIHSEPFRGKPHTCQAAAAEFSDPQAAEAFLADPAGRPLELFRARPAAPVSKN